MPDRWKKNLLRKPNTYYVWDKINSNLNDASRIQDFTPKGAALKYAREDSDGSRYHTCSQPICVMPMKGGKTITFEVRAKMEPTFYASESSEDGQLP